MVHDHYLIMSWFTDAYLYASTDAYMYASNTQLILMWNVNMTYIQQLIVLVLTVKNSNIYSTLDNIYDLILFYRYSWN